MVAPVTSYFHELSEAISNAKVTDWHGESVPLDEGMARAIDMLAAMSQTAHKVMLIGNGGSAAIVSHVQNDLCKQAGIRALVFTEQPLLTALANDCSYESVFERPVELWANSGDLLIAVSGSGQSENILRAVHAATLQGCQIITFSGFQADNSLRRMGDVNFYVSAHTYGVVESAHMALINCLIDHVVAGFKTDNVGE
jgi:D-sedoheptulose 7-phosphate isomerase